MAESRSLGEAIRQRRVELSMSQEELAELIGPDVRQSDVSRLERGKILFPRLERLNQIADALGISIGTLLVEAGWFTEEESAQVSIAEQSSFDTTAPILVADDEPVSLEAIVALLNDYGYGAATAYDLPSLLEAFEATAPEVVIVDIALPGLNPEDLIESVAGMRPSPLLVFMGLGLPEVDGPYLEKPIDSRLLLAFVESIGTHRPKADRLGDEGAHIAAS